MTFPAPSITTFSSSNIDEILVAGPLPDGYWVQAFQFSSRSSERPDLIAYGLGFRDAPSTIRLFTNPFNDSRISGWKVSEIASLDFPVGMTVADLTGNGYNDVIICDRYGPSMDDLWSAETQDGGRIQWLRNPGKRSGEPFWEAMKIGNSTGMHRLQAGHFTRADVIEVMGLPIIAKSSDLDSPAPVIIFTPVYDGLDKSIGPTSWEKRIAFSSEFRLIHDVKLLPRGNGELDMVVVSGREGIVALWFEIDKNTWSYNVVGEGLPQPSGSPYFKGYWGSGSVEICRAYDDNIGYIATCEAFHGHVVSVYVKDNNAPKGPASLKSSTYWTRKVIDIYGQVDPESHTGPLHHVAAVPLPKEHRESFAVACMGVRRPSGDKSRQGVYLYQLINLRDATFKKIKLTGESAGRLAVAPYISPEFNIASLSYYVPGYLTGPAPPTLRINCFGTAPISCFATKLENEILLRIPRPSALAKGQDARLPFWTLAGKALTLIVLTENDHMVLDHDVIAVKVIYGMVITTSESLSKILLNYEYVGQLTMKEKDTDIVRGIAPPSKTVGSTVIPTNKAVRAGEGGTVFITVVQAKDSFQGPFTTMDQISSVSALPSTNSISQVLADMSLPFVRVDQLSWASGGLWDNFQFYNAVGFHVHFNDESLEKIVHIQAWTLGIGETARFHKHSDSGKSFCEIHYCLSNGGGTGGMRYFADEYNKPIDTKAELTRKYVEENSALIVVPSLFEHGPLWKIQPNNQAKPQILPNAAVDYPWHAWLASSFGDYGLPIDPPLGKEKQRFDVWLAFEFPPSAFQI